MIDVSPKLKIVYLMKLFMERTDDDHSVTMAEIREYLDSVGIKAERKSIYSDIQLLKDYGLDIIGEQYERGYHYKLASRNFELAELKLLVDSVSSAKFITEKKTNELIKKIEGLASKYEALKLQRQVFVGERIKSENEQILINVDVLHAAISNNSTIRFQYFNWNKDKKMELRHDGAFYEMSPWALTLSDENYYLVAFDDKENKIKYFRVDKMLKISLTGEMRKGKEEFNRFDIAAYSKKRFHMYDGPETLVTLRCKNSYAGVIIDRFGTDVSLRKVNEDFFEVKVNVAVSNQFLGWVLSMSEHVKITAPKSVVERTKELINTMKEQYG